MSLTVVAGLPGSGRTRWIREHLLGAVREERSALLLVLSAGAAARARERMAPDAPVGLRIATLDGVVEAEWMLKGDGRRFVSGFQRDVLAGRALEQRGVCAKAGTGAVSLLIALAQLHVAAGSHRVASASGLSGRLAAAVEAYAASLRHAGLVEPAEAFGVLSRAEPPAGVIALDGCSALTPSQERILAGWGDAGADVLVSLPWSEGAVGTEPTAALIARLREGGGSVLDLGVTKDGRSAELERVETALFAGGPPSPGEGGVRLGVAHGDEAEARLIAAMVTDLIRSGARGDAVSVAFADPPRHAGWLGRAFDDAGIPADWDVRTPVGGTPFGRALLRMWAFCGKGMEREDLGAFLRSPFSGVRIEDADRADEAWRRGGVLGGEALLTRAGMMRPLVRKWQALAAEPLGADTGKKWKALADGLLSNAYPGVAPVIGAGGTLDAAAHRRFCSAVEEAAILGEGAVTPGELFEAFARCSVSGAGTRTPGSVLVTSVDRVPEEAREHLVLGGLTASEFPRQGAEDRIEGDAVRGALSALGIDVDPAERARAERLAFYLAVSTPRRSLALVRRASDDEGRSLRESVLWDEFLDLYRDPMRSSGEITGVTVEDVPAPGLERQGGADRRDRGHIVETRVLAGLEQTSAVSPGEVEVYTGCPYRWFVEKRLRASAPDVTLDRMAAGSIMHAALALFYRRWTQEAPRVTAANVPSAVRLAKECAGQVMASGPRPAGLEAERLLADIMPAIERLVVRDASFLPDYIPEHVEWSFGLAGEDDPVDVGGVLVRGRADRIDVGPEGLLVIDYKRSRASSLAHIQRDGLVQLQLYAAAASTRLGLPIAGGLYRSLAGDEDRGFVLRGVSGAFKPKDVIDRDEVDAVVEQAIESARVAVASMRAGRIEPRPLKERCAYCAASPFCTQAVG